MEICTSATKSVLNEKKKQKKNTGFFLVVLIRKLTNVKNCNILIDFSKFSDNEIGTTYSILISLYISNLSTIIGICCLLVSILRCWDSIFLQQQQKKNPQKAMGDNEWVMTITILMSVNWFRLLSQDCVQRLQILEA